MMSEGFDLLRKDIAESRAMIESVRGSGVPCKGRPVSRLWALRELDRADCALDQLQGALCHVPMAGDIAIPGAAPAKAPVSKAKSKSKGKRKGGDK